MAERLKIENLSCGYGNNVILQNIQLTLQAGEICCCIGPNGCGKSTFLKTVGRHLTACEGRVILDGREDYTEPEFAKKCAILLTDKVQVEYMTCREIVSLGRYPYTGRLSKLSEADEKRISEVMQELHICELSEKYFNQISDGQRQRVLIARALVQDTPLIILDEPTTYLDIRYKYELIELLRVYAAQKNKTILMTLHETELVELVADIVISFKEGQVFDCGKAAEMLKKEKVAELFDLQGIAAYFQKC